MKSLFTKALNLFSVLLLILALCVSFFAVAQPNEASAAWDGTVAASFASGSGTESNPYIIKTESQLGYFFQQLKSGVTYEGMYIQLNNDPDMTGSSWGTGGNTFKGNFHGMGYTITAQCPFFTTIGETATVQGVNYVMAVDYDDDVFCTTNNGTLLGCVVMGNASSDTTQETWTHSIGLLCNTNYGTIRGCGGVGTVYAKGDDSDAYAGLIAKNHGVVDHCYSAVSASASAPGKYNYAYSHPLVGSNNLSGTGATVTDCIYDKDIYTYTTSIGYGMTTAELQSSTALSYLGGYLPTSCKWVIDDDMGGYPHMAHTSPYYSYVTGHQGESLILYNAKSTYVTLTKSASVGTIYYTLDASETDPANFKVYSSGSSIFISGDAVLSTAVYYNGSFGSVTRQEFFSLPGSGTASSPYQISTPKQLTALGMFPDASFVLTADITFTDEDYTLTGAAPGQWTPISTFRGTLDGQGHYISGLKSRLGGLIDSNAGTITSLRMIDHRLHGPVNSGAIANRNSGTVTRCYTKSAFTLTSLPSVQDPEIGQEVGGVVGYNGGTVSYCRNDGIVAVTDTTREAHLWLGGIVGDGNAENCINNGLLVVSNSTTINYPYIGGITGCGDVDNCLSTGNVYLNILCNYSTFVSGLSGFHSSGFAHTSVTSDFTITRVGNTHSTVVRSPFHGCYQGNASTCYMQENIQLPEDCTALDFDSVWMVSNDGVVPQGVMDENGHAYRLSTSQIYPTCRANGDQWVVCDICGDTDVITVQAIGHRYTNYVSDGNATCLEDGTKTAKCDRCEYTNTKEDTGSALGHTFVDHVSDGNATCLEDGTKTGKCERCEVTETVADTGSALGHSFTNYISNGDALCETDGTKTAQCDRCEVTETITDEGTALGHSFTAYNSNGDATCLEDGTKTAKCDRCDVTDTLTEEGTALGHSFVTYVSDGNAGCYADGTETARCERCEVTDTRTEEGTAGHLFTNYVSNNNATCLYPGTQTAKCDRCEVKDTQVEIGSQKGHSFTNYISNGDATCLEDGTVTAMCDRCTVTDTTADEGSALGHGFTNYVSDGNVTCTEDGTQTAKCDRCDVTDTIVLPALGHDMGQWYTVTEASCTMSGLERSDCGRCGHIEERILPILPHSYSPTVTDPTCTEQGYTTYTCACGESYVSDNMPVLGHSFTEYVSDGNVTCTEDGTQTAKCDRCDITDTVTLKALGHSFTNYTSIGNATCEADGLKIATCDRCLEMDYAVDVGSMLGHEVGQWYTVTEAGCLTEGVEKANCIRCGSYSEERTIPAAGHSFTEYVSDGNAACTEDGTETSKCDNCDVTDTVTVEGSALGHSYGEWVRDEEAGIETGTCARCGETEEREITEYSGVCGDNLTWTLNTVTGELRISGTGDMYDYDAQNEAPWKKYASSIHTLTLEEGITRIGNWAFTVYFDFIEITLPESLRSIGSYAFTHSSELVRINIPKNVVSIEAPTFSGCEKLEEFLVDPENPCYSDLDGVLFNKDQTALLCYPDNHGEEFVIPETVTTVGRYAFYESKNLRHVTIPDCVSIMEYGAFCRSNIEEVALPESLTCIEDHVFAVCTKLKTVHIPDSITSIGSSAFQQCAMEEIVLPESITHIGDSVFTYCESLKSISIPEGVTAIEFITFRNCYSLESVTIPQSVTSIDKKAFEGCSALTEVRYGGTEEMKELLLIESENETLVNANWICRVCEHSFGDWETVTAPTCTEEGEEIRYCSDCIATETQIIPAAGHSYEAVVIDPTCTEQGYTTHTCHCGDSYVDGYVDAKGHSFTEYVSDGNATCTEDGTETSKCDNCDVTDTVTEEGSALGHSISHWEQDEANATETGICDRCGVTEKREALLSSGVCGEGVSWKLNIAGTLTIYGSGSMYDYGAEEAPWASYRSKIKAIEIDTGVTYIGMYAFADCKLATSATLCTTVITIGDNAFQNCTLLSQVCIPDGVAEIGEGVFTDCISLRELVLPDSISGIGKEAFARCTSLENIEISFGITELNSSLFLGCSSLSNVTIPDSVTRIGHGAFSRCTSLQTVCIPQSVTAVDDYAFSTCSSLTEITLPDTVTEIGEGVFYDCTLLESIQLSASISSIENTAFHGCQRLKRIEIPEGVIMIGDSAFYGCTALNEIIMPESVTVIGENAFFNYGIEGRHVYYAGNSEQWNALGDGRPGNAKVHYTYTTPDGHWTAEELAATCLEDGYTREVCICGHTRNEVVLPALDHDWSEWETVQEATCTALGIRRRDCSYCDQFETDDIPMVSHSYESTVTEPTCTMPGYTVHICSCGDQFSSDYTDELGHDMGEWYTVTEATCTVEGLEQKDCSRCDHFEMQYIAAVGHSYEAVVTDPTCTEQGYTTHTCHCGDSYVDGYVDAKGHSFTEYVSDGNAACTEDGTETAKCDNCDVTDTVTEEGSALGHDMGQWYTVTEAACTEEGLEQKDCGRCDHFETQAIAAVGHSYEAVVTDPTCTEQGYTTHTCHCGDSYVDSYTDVLGHSFTDYISDGNATCTEDGTKTAKCDNCDATDTVTEVGSIVGHDLMGQWVTVTEATCTQDGLEQAKCIRCDYTETSVIPFTGHSYEAVVTEPTCTEHGFTTYTCHCGDSYVGSYTDALGHSFGLWYVEGNAERRDCEQCAHFETRELPVQKLTAPTLAISANTDTGKPRISWNAVEGAEKYRIYRSTKKTSGFEYLKSTKTVTSYTDDTAEVGVNYYYKVKAYHADSAANSDWSNTVNRVCDLAKPSVTMSVKTATGQPVVKWETVEGAVKYRVYRSEKKSSGYELVKTAVTARSYTDVDAMAGTNYYYKVKAIHSNSSANSAYSTVINRVCDLPKPVVEITLTAGGNPRLTWEVIEGAAKYRVYRSDAKDGEYELVKTTVTVTSFTDKEAASGKVWYYKVRAIHENSSANSAYSSVKSITAE